MLKLLGDKETRQLFVDIITKILDDVIFEFVSLVLILNQRIVQTTLIAYICIYSPKLKCKTSTIG